MIDLKTLVKELRSVYNVTEYQIDDLKLLEVTLNTFLAKRTLLKLEFQDFISDIRENIDLFKRIR